MFLREIDSVTAAGRLLHKRHTEQGGNNCKGPFICKTKVRKNKTKETIHKWRL